MMPQGKWIGTGLLLVFVAVPFRVLGGTFSEVRVIIAAILIMPAFVVFSPTSQGIRFAVPAALSAIAVLNAGHAATIWFSYQSEYERLRKSFVLLKRGAFVLVGQSTKQSSLLDELTDRPMYHAPVLSAHYAAALVPSLFTISGQYVLQVRPELKRFDIPTASFYEPVPMSVLGQISKGSTYADLPSHVRCWINDYDYLYLVGPQGPNPIPTRLTALAAGERFTLYHIVNPAREALGDPASPSTTCLPTTPVR